MRPSSPHKGTVMLGFGILFDVSVNIVEQPVDMPMIDHHTMLIWGHPIA